MMGDAMDAVGGDGFLIEAPGFQPSRWFAASITDALVPALQRRGRTRTEYTGATLRENLLAFLPKKGKHVGSGAGATR